LTIVAASIHTLEAQLKAANIAMQVLEDGHRQATLDKEQAHAERMKVHAICFFW
tara:strand:+ start:528 stop:689 length:162 start_codon:yes stop_codon:yes gene_type:complete